MNRPPRLRFRDELRDFLAFVRRPRLGPRLPRPAMPSLAADWAGSIDLWQILRWTFVLWAVNLVVLGPLAAVAAFAGGATHRLDPFDIPWVLAILWAPLVEELLFRFGLRRPGAALWLMPAFAAVLWLGRGWATGLFLALSLALVCWPGLPGVRWSFGWNRAFRRVFPFVFHLAALAFAVAHLMNFTFANAVWWLLPVLVIPQWATGLVLGWLRVRTGIGASIVAHALFNAGPVLLLLLLSGAARNAGLPLPS